MVHTSIEILAFLWHYGTQIFSSKDAMFRALNKLEKESAEIFFMRTDNACLMVGLISRNIDCIDDFSILLLRVFIT